MYTYINKKTEIHGRFQPFIKNRCDRIRTCDLCVPNAALYQAEPRIDTPLIIRKKGELSSCFGKRGRKGVDNRKNFMYPYEKGVSCNITFYKDRQLSARRSEPIILND